MSSALASKSRSFRMSDQDQEHMRRLRHSLAGRSQTEVISLALTHLLATIERDERVHVSTPSDERAELGESGPA